MNAVNIRALPIEIISVHPLNGVELKIGDIPAAIAEPKRWLTQKGYVSLITTDMENGDWESLVSCKIYGNDGVEMDGTGLTDDPRLVRIAEKILLGRHMEELSPGQVFLPQEDPRDSGKFLKSEEPIRQQPSAKKKTHHKGCNVT